MQLLLKKTKKNKIKNLDTKDLDIFNDYDWHNIYRLHEENDHKGNFKFIFRIVVYETISNLKSSKNFKVPKMEKYPAYFGAKIFKSKYLFDIFIIL